MGTLGGRKWQCSVTIIAYFLSMAIKFNLCLRPGKNHRFESGAPVLKSVKGATQTGLYIRLKTAARAGAHVSHRLLLRTRRGLVYLVMTTLISFHE